MFNFGASAASSNASSGSAKTKNSYTGSFIDSGSSVVVSIKPEDSVSNVGSSISQSMMGLQIGGGPAAGGPQAAGGAASSNVTFSCYFNSDPRVSDRADYGNFVVHSKNALTYAGGKLLKIAHNANEFREFMGACHMQYLHLLDVQTVTLTEVTKLNKFLFEDHITIDTNWGKCQFYRNYKNYIVKPVVLDLYKGAIADVFFQSTKTSAAEPLSKAAFTEWLARE
jgi:hypothetical protein